MALGAICSGYHRIPRKVILEQALDVFERSQPPLGKKKRDQ